MNPIALNTPSPQLSESERAHCAALARWLDASNIIGTLGLFAAAVAALWITLGSTHNAIVTAALALALMPIERYYALRLRFDRGLFADLADGRLASLDALDAALTGLGLRRTVSPSRPPRRPHSRRAAAVACACHRRRGAGLAMLARAGATALIANFDRTTIHSRRIWTS